MGTMDREASIKLLSTILADTVRLTGAACIGKHQLFDQIPGNGGHPHQEQIRRAEAARLCARCPAIRHCPSVTVTTGALSRFSSGLNFFSSGRSCRSGHLHRWEELDQILLFRVRDIEIPRSRFPPAPSR
jgi:hypothetical protein